MRMNPLVSVVITVHNQAPFVAATLDSVLAQTYPNVEVVVVDDGSTDDTLARCRRYGDRLRLLPRPNGGVAVARNTGLAAAQGAYIAHLDGDDLWHPEKLARQVEAARRFPGAGMIIADGHSFEDGMPDAPGLITGEMGRRLSAATEPAVEVDCYRALIQRHGFNTPSQIMVPAAVYATLGRWDERMRVVTDVEMGLRIAARYPFVLMRDDLVGYRVHDASLSGPRRSRQFTWGLETFTALRIHRRQAAGAVRRLLAERMVADTRTLARDAYYVGWHGDRAWALGYELRLLAASRRPDLVLPFVLGLLLPGRLIAATRRLRRPTSADGLGNSFGGSA
jgi:glycosyltransferase involved in cell wall biosynthesis